MARPVRTPDCHPERPHKAKGLCAPCYSTAWEANRGTYRNGTKATCHPDRRHKARGLCSQCYKAASRRGDFGHRPANRDQRMATCHPDRPHAGKGLCRECYDRVRNRMAMYGLTPEQMATLERDADGKCMICRQPGARLVVDHSHDTGEVRGLLCSVCNTQLGVIERRGPQWLAAALSYLQG